MSFAFLHVNFAMQDLVTNQKLAPDCSRGSSRKLFSRFLCGSFAEACFAGIYHVVTYST